MILFHPMMMQPSAGASAWTPASYSGSVLLWLQASDSSTITESGGAVSQWSDKSGNGKHATQSTTAAKPTFTTVSGKNVVSFDGSDDVMTFPSLGSGPYIVCIAFRLPTNPAGEADIIGNGSPLVNLRPYWAGGGSGSSRLPYFGTTQLQNYSTRLYTGNYIWLVKSRSYDRMNGAAGLSGDGGSNGFTGTGILGKQVNGSVYLNCQIHSAVVATYPSDANDIYKLEGWAAWDAGLEGSLASDHPYKSAAP